MFTHARLLALLATVILALTAGSAAADPVTRVISPNGSGIECSMVTPCSYLYGMTAGSAAGDVVLALPGTYVVTGAPPELKHPLTVMGDPDKPRPVFVNLDQAISWGMIVDAGASGTVLKHLDIEGFHGLFLGGQTTASDLAVKAKSRCITIQAKSTVAESALTVAQPSAPLCVEDQVASTLRHLTITAPGGTGVALRGGGATFEDSTVTADAPLQLTDGNKNANVRRVSLNGTLQAIWASQGGWGVVTDSLIRTSGTSSAVQSRTDGRVTLRNDTVLAAGSGAAGLKAEAAFSSAHAGSIDARNTIVHANGPDLVAAVAPDPSTCIPAPCKPGELTIDHSLFNSSTGPIVNNGSNVSGDPLFSDAAIGDFHLHPGSPAIDAGAADVLTGATDLDEKARILGPALDLGAFEAPAVPTPPAGEPAPADQTPPVGAPRAADLTPPVLSSVRLSNRVFAVGRGATALSAVKRGTTLRYRVSEAARVTIELARRATKTRFRHVATLTRRAHAGINSTRLSGRIKTRALKPGVYRATLTARDVAGNKSRAARVKFTVVA